MTDSAVSTTAPPVSDVIGDSARRPDGVAKTTGEFAYSSDLWMEGMLWGVTLRSPHPYARVRSVDIGPALATPGVYAVLTYKDVPGANRYGLEFADQPVLAEDMVRYQGEPVAVVAADHPEIARQAAARIAVGYEVLDPVTSARAAMAEGAPRLHPGGNVVRHLKLRTGDPAARADLVITGEYQVGMQDQAFLGPESGLAVPAEDGGVDLFVATQWLHADQRQICQALGLPPELVRLTLAGVGGAFGGREDLSMHVHACLLARHTGKPVKMVYSREESFFGHVHRHPATMRYEHGVSAGGRLVYVKAEVYFDGGAYASSTAAVVGNGGTMGFGPYVVPNGVDGLLRRLHQQPAVRRDARVRRGADGLRVRVADGPLRGRAGPGSGRVPAAERHVRGIAGADGPDHRQPGAGRRTAAHGAGDAAPARRCWSCGWP